jgi:Zn-dependent protease
MPEMERLFSLQVLGHAAIYLVALILSICVHEFGHAFVADRLGDRLPRAQGRVTLNPIAHIDPIGTIAFPLISFFLSAAGSGLGSRILGWGKPVEISLHARWIRRGMSLRTAHMMISVAGPLMNLAFAAVLSLVFIVLARVGFGGFGEIMLYVTSMNIGLAFFNLIPCPPLDGGAILASVLGDRNPVVMFLNRYGQFLFLMLLFTGLLTVLLVPIRYIEDWWEAVLLHWALR